MNPILWCGNAYDHDRQAAANLIVQRQPAARSILCVIGYGSVDEEPIRTALDECERDSAVPVLWIGPSFKALDEGSVDLAALPESAGVFQLAALLGRYAHLPMVGRTLFECFNHTPAGKPRYRDGATFRACFDGIAAKLPKNVLRVWSYGPNGWPVKFADWRPASAQVADCSQFGKAHRSASHPAGKNALAFAQVAHALGLPLIVGESGLMSKDYPNLIGTELDEALKADAKGLLTWCVDHDARLLAGPFASGNYGMVDWTDFPQTSAFLRKKLGSTAFLSLPLAQPAGVSPLVAAGLVA